MSVAGRPAFLLFCAWLGGGLVTAAPPAADDDPSPAPLTTPAVVQVVLFFVPEMGYQSTVAYDVPTTREEALADLAVLAAGLGYASVEELRPTLPDRAEPLPFTFEVLPHGLTVGFRVSERAFHRDKGTFKLEPVINAFRRHRRIDLEIMVADLAGRRFAYRGLGNWEDRVVRLRHHATGVSHAFAIEVLDPSFGQLDLPPYAPPELPLQSDTKPRREAVTWRELLVLAVCAGSASLATFLLVYWGLRKWRRADGRRMRR